MRSSWLSLYTGLDLTVPSVRPVDRLLTQCRVPQSAIICVLVHTFVFFPFLKIFIYLFLETGKEGEREGEKHDVGEKQRSVASLTPPARDLAHNPGMCPDREANL